MRVLVLADEPNNKLWSERCREMLAGTDLILSAGDLPSSYLSFLTCFTHAPIVYVHGNHDDKYMQKPPEGCICAEDRIVTVDGVRILGLGGSIRYRPGGCMYTEEEMRSRVRKAGRLIRAHRGFDILLTHAPVKGVGDQADNAHKGFACFETLLDRYRPTVMFHGHVHQSYTAAAFIRERECHGVPVINASEFFFYDLPETGDKERPRWYAGILDEKIRKKKERELFGNRKQLQGAGKDRD